MTCDPDNATSKGPIALDEHRGMAAQKATDLRRLVGEVEAQRAALAARQQELEKHLFAEPAKSWEEAVHKARYLLALFAKEVALRAHGVPGSEEALESLVEILAHAERNLSGAPGG